ncbi:hypothetical protein B0H16DRAFT_1848513 [Mycena metata]|uniref:Uncharacterized protein n=1 Tax=Mycena metata TaxID=1033252 RepID=A0AAD7ITJ8_9AGAR|nr:hypothetical protein B0H16DRAFT_1848513 [Mycena metata]
MRLTSTTAALLCLFFSLSPTALGNSEIEVRGGKDDGHGKHNSPCFPFILDNNDCVRGRCKDSHKCELGFSLDPIRLCCVKERYRRGDDGYGDGKGDGGYGQGGDKGKGGKGDGGYGGGKGDGNGNHNGGGYGNGGGDKGKGGKGDGGYGGGKGDGNGNHNGGGYGNGGGDKGQGGGKGQGGKGDGGSRGTRELPP